MNITSSYASAAYAVQTTQAVSSTRAASTSETTTQSVDRLEAMKEKYKDVYTPIPETYSAEDEALQQQKIDEAYPDYISGSEFLKIVSGFYDGEPITPGKKITQEQKDQQEIAFQKAYDLFGGEKAYKEMQKGVEAIKNLYPVNTWAKDGFADNAKELARFRNAAVYEGMEQGLSLKEATKQAQMFEYSFMDTSYKSDMRDKFFAQVDRDYLIKIGIFQPAPEGERIVSQKELDFNDPYNSTMDLRKYGIEGAWETHNIIGNQDAMLQEIVKKIGQFNFMLNNESLIEDAYQKLDGSAHNLRNNEGYKDWINKELMPEMQLGYEVFSQYKIYDSVDIKV